MISFQEALLAVAGAAPRLGSEAIPIAEAAGRVLAEDVTSDLDLPPFDTTAMDGWAVRRADALSVPRVLDVAGAIGAGSLAESPLPTGSALKVMTGAPMPERSDAVVPVEEAKELPGGRVELLTVPKPGAHIRRRGEVLVKGARLLSPGRILTPSDLVLAAAAGADALLVVRRPRAAVLVTGDEILPPASSPGPGQIRNTNGPLLAGSLRRLGAEVTSLGIARDDRDELTGILAKALATAPDYLLTTGGVSAGDYDLVGEVLTALGAKTVFHRVAIRPAKPVLFATLGDTLIFGLPGNPVSAAVAFDFFVRTAWRQGSGVRPSLPEAVEAFVTLPVGNKGSRHALLGAHLRHEKGRLLATPIASKGSHDIVAHAAANGYLSVPPETVLVEGDRADVYL